MPIKLFIDRSDGLRNPPRSQVRKKFSILIISESGGKLRNYTISQLTARILLGIFICILVGTVWLIFEYANIAQKSLKIRALKRENEEIRQKHEKFQQFESEFKEFKDRLIKIANALDIKQSSATSVAKVSFSPKDSFVNLVSGISPKEQTLVEERIKEMPSIYPVKGWITQRFSPSHPAVDLAAEYGASVVSTISGTVEFVGENPILGETVEITNEKGFKIIYGHLARIIVVEGTKVKCGDLIGFVGSTGESSAPHLHYEIRLNGIPHDPELYLSK